MFDHVSLRQGCLELNVISHNKPTFCKSYGCYDMEYFNVILELNSYLTIHNKCILTQYISHNDDDITPRLFPYLIRSYFARLCFKCVVILMGHKFC